MNQFLLPFCLFVLFAACDSQNPLSPKSISSSLIGGQEPKDRRFAATIITENCTATKIGNTIFITAAHCVTDPKAGNVYLQMAPGKSINIKSNRHAPWIPLTIKEISVPQGYLEKMAQLISWGANGHLALHWSSDIAFIKVEEETPTIPEIKLTFSKIESEQEVFIAGAGCEHYSGERMKPEDRRLKVHAVKTLPIETISDNLSPVIDPNAYPTLAQTDKLVFLSEGKALSKEAASICPGDSGGPAFFYENGEYKLAGIHTYYTFSDGGQISDTNMHTRLSNPEIKEWLYHNIGGLSYLENEWDKIENEIVPPPIQNPIILPHKVAGFSFNMTQNQIEKILSPAQYHAHPTPLAVVYQYKDGIGVQWKNFSGEQKPQTIYINKHYQGELDLPPLGPIKLGDHIDAELSQNDPRFYQAIRDLYNRTYQKESQYDCFESNECRWGSNGILSFRIGNWTRILFYFNKKNNSLDQIKLMAVQLN